MYFANFEAMLSKITVLRNFRVSAPVPDYEGKSRMYAVRENMENIENKTWKSQGQLKKIAQVREKSGKFIFSPSDMLKC